MAEATGEVNFAPQTRFWRRLDMRAWITGNPVILKELRGRMRGGRAFLLLTLYLFFMSAIISLIYLAFITANNGFAGIDLRQTIGKTLFSVTMLLQLFTACFVAPALTAGAISSEREGQTFDLLRTTLLSAQALVFGKLNTSFLFILLLLFASLPLLSMATIFGGVTAAELLIGAVLLIVTTLAFSAIGIFFSSFTKRTLISTVLAYSFTLLLVFGVPAFIFTTIAFFGAMSASPAGISRIGELFLIFGIYLMVMINPIATALVTELLLLEGSVFVYNMPLPANTGTIPIFSPWLAYAVLFLSLSFLLIWLSIFFVRQAER